MTVATPFSSEELIAILKWLVRDKFYLTSKVEGGRGRESI